ncbi:MAG: hypothetical protein J0L92_11735 [Deltaproteobacteria bacterium]|nr:hypothetical protein [Deltaproteobacteria bacterium]
MYLGSLGVSAQVPETLRNAGHHVSVFTRTPSRAEARALDLLVVCGHPRPLGADVFGAPRLGTWNVHPSLLPWRRGPQPVRWAILSGDEWYGVSIHQMTQVIDTGPLWWQDRIPRGEGGHHAVLHALVARAARALPSLVARAEGGERARPVVGIGSRQGRVPPALLRLDPALDAEMFRRRVAADDDRGPSLEGPRGLEVLGAVRRVEAQHAHPGTVLAVTSTTLTFAVRDAVLCGTTRGEPRARVGEVLLPRGLA